jgi:aminoglycoside/choline kinase family phosphotransferase
MAGALAPELRDRIARVAARCLGEPVREVHALPAGLGLRRWFRVVAAGRRTAIARLDADEDPAGRPAGVPAEPELEPVRALFERAGLPVPRSLGRDPAERIDLLEDLGDTTLAAAVGSTSGTARERWIARAVDLIPRIQRVKEDRPGIAAFARRLAPPWIAYKADLFVRYSLADALAREPRPSESAAVREAFAWIAAEVERSPFRLAHRDLQSQNLMVRGESLAMIDLQGAFLAPPEYDLVSLLRDSYLGLPDELVERQLARVRPLLPDAPDPDSFRKRFALLTLTRKGKDHARFRYAALERGDTRFLGYAASTSRVLARAARASAGADPALARLAELLSRWEAASCAP